MVKVGIIGGTGYTGIELLRLLANHSQAEVTVLTSRSEAGKKVSDYFPNLSPAYPSLAFSEPSVENLAQCDVVFFATPHGVAHSLAGELMATGVKIIDLSADFRIKDIAVWEEWYGQKHAAPELIDQAVYGLPEVNREAIKKAQLVAVPGCYPTAVQLGLLPLFTNKLAVTSGLIADCKSGVSGAGRAAKLGSLYCEAGENFKAYSVGVHRHQPEIVQGLSLAAGEEVNLTFVPHLVPMQRGIFASLYVELNAAGKKLNLDELHALYADFYDKESFVELLENNSYPETRSIKGSNMCKIALHLPAGSPRLIVLAAIDNLVKGASGQAVQNMNLMFGFNESEGLSQIGLAP